MKVGWHAYLYIELFMPVIYMNHTHEQLWYSIVYFAKNYNDMAILRFTRYPPSLNGNSIGNVSVK